MADHNALGILGEDLAEAFLRKKKYVILHKNWRKGKSEVDLICSKDELLIFVEVKTRTHTAYGAPHEAVTPKKQEELRKAVDAFFNEFPHIDLEVRFDIIEVVNPLHKNARITHLPDAFQ